MHETSFQWLFRISNLAILVSIYLSRLPQESRLGTGNYWRHCSIFSRNILTTLNCLFDNIISTALVALSRRHRCKVVCSKWWIVGTQGKVAASAIIPQQSISCWSGWLYIKINCLWYIYLAWDMSSLIVWALLMLILSHCRRVESSSHRVHCHA